MWFTNKIKCKNTYQSTQQDAGGFSWNQYSDNYVAATAPNGYTALASKSAATLTQHSSKIKPNKANPADAKKRRC